MTWQQFAFFMMVPLGAFAIAGFAYVTYRWEEAQLQRQIAESENTRPKR